MREIDQGIISDRREFQMERPKQHDPNLPRISELDLTPDRDTRDWPEFPEIDWPKFPESLRVKLYGRNCISDV